MSGLFALNLFLLGGAMAATGVYGIVSERFVTKSAFLVIGGAITVAAGFVTMTHP